MEFLKDFLGIFLNIYTYYIEAIKFIYAFIISNKSYLDFFMIYTANIIPVLFMFKRLVGRTFIEVFSNITVHIYVFAMTAFPLISDKELILRDINGDTTEMAKVLFIWFLLTLFGIQSMAHKVSVRAIAGKRVVDYKNKNYQNNRRNENNNYQKKKRNRQNKSNQNQEVNTSTKDLPTEVKEKEQNQI